LISLKTSETALGILKLYKHRKYVCVCVRVCVCVCVQLYVSDDIGFDYCAVCSDTNLLFKFTFPQGESIFSSQSELFKKFWLA